MTNKENSQFHSLIQSNNKNSVHGSSEKKNENQDTIQPVTIVLDNGIYNWSSSLETTPS